MFSVATLSTTLQHPLPFRSPFYLNSENNLVLETLIQNYNGADNSVKKTNFGLPSEYQNAVGHFRITFSLFLKASLGAHLFI